MLATYASLVNNGSLVESTGSTFRSTVQIANNRVRWRYGSLGWLDVTGATNHLQATKELIGITRNSSNINKAYKGGTEVVSQWRSTGGLNASSIYTDQHADFLAVMHSLGWSLTHEFNATEMGNLESRLQTMNNALAALH
jgi:hypothetical protein